MAKKTSIQVSVGTRKRLYEMKGAGVSYEEYILGLLRECGREE